MNQHMNEPTAIFRALADPTRRAIFERLTRDELSVKQIADAMPISQPAVSQHLNVLSEAQLVSGRRQGRQTFYSAVPHGLQPLIDWMEPYRAFWTERVEALNDLLDQMEEEEP